MKTNKALRLAAILLILTLVSFSGIGSAYAKYISSDSARDTARVAKFGVVASVYGDLFDPAYSGPAANKIVSYSDTSATVKAVQQADLIAPGTKGGTLTISLKGTPETGTSITLDHVKGSYNKPYAVVSPYLKAHTYCVPVVYDGTATAEDYGSFCDSQGITLTSMPSAGTTVYKPLELVTVTADYYPLVWKVSVNGGTVQSYTGATAVTNAWNAIQSAANSALASNTPNTAINFTATVTWEWPFAGDNEYQSKCDTILGEISAGYPNVNSDYRKSKVYCFISSNRTSGNRKGQVWYNLKDIPFSSDNTADQKLLAAFSGSGAGGSIAAKSAQQVSGKGTALDAVLSAAFDVSLTIAQTD